MNSFPSAKSAPVMATALLSITLMSFASAVSAQAPGGPGARVPQTRHAERMMLLYDLNGDGKITIAEINTDQARIFTALDVNDDKKMSVEEIKRRGRSLQIFRTTTLFDLLDANGDGTLSVTEVQAPSKRWFKRYDLNGNGVMESDEIPVGRRRGGRHGGRH